MTVKTTMTNHDLSKLVFHILKTEHPEAEYPEEVSFDFLLSDEFI